MYFECSILKHFQAEEERIRKEEEERREHEEYLKLKEAFSIEEEGEEDVGPDLSVSYLPLITERMALIGFLRDQGWLVEMTTV